jgi:diguanylate cyclase (GGDEF)-like protein
MENQSLNELFERFSHHLPERIRGIKEVFHNDQDKLEKAESIEHLLAGLAEVSATFGFGELARCAAELLRSLKLSKSEEDLQRNFQEGYRLLESLLERLPKDAAFTDSEQISIGEPSSVKLVIFDREYYLFPMLLSQLSLFGYSTQVVTNSKEFEATCNSDAKIVAIVNAQLLKDDPSVVELIDDIQLTRHISFLYISHKDDFRTRLMSVRHGGDSFFLLPLDNQKLIDRIDQIIVRKTEEPFHVLLIDDDPEQIAFNAMVLQQAGMITSVASDPEKVLDVLVESKPELILVDMYMPGCNGLELTSVIRQMEVFVGVPILFLSSESDRKIQMEAIKRGADDYLVKPVRPRHLVDSISTRIERSRIVRYHMERDSLTGLLNHSHLKEQLSREVARAERSNTELCFVMIDADHFKNINDSYGHMSGDRVLKNLAKLFTERLRRIDIIGRWGGEEFGIIMVNINKEKCRNIIESIRMSFAEMVHYAEDMPFTCTFSAGISSFPQINSPTELTSASDKALYMAKEMGRNCVVVT